MGDGPRSRSTSACQLGVIDVYRRVHTRPIAVAETQAFARSAAKIWSEEELAALIDHVAHNPEAGDLIPGTGGVRKMRWVRYASASAAARG